MASQYRTRNDLILTVLEDLGVLPAGQAPGVEDTSRVDSELDQIAAKLMGLEIVYLPDLANIPLAYFDDVAAICADLLKTKFGVSAEDAMQLERDGLGMPPGTGAAALSLKAMQRGKPSYEAQQTLYF